MDFIEIVVLIAMIAILVFIVMAGMGYFNDQPKESVGELIFTDEDRTFGIGTTSMSVKQKLLLKKELLLDLMINKLQENK